ncbi:PTS beta-glucoside transporter subunit EIIBCA, partial [Enterococcus faecium]
VDFISGTFVPVLPILVAAGLVSAVLTIGVTFFGLSAESGTYTILNAVNDAGFYFLPIYIGFSAARKLGINGMMGMFLG